MIDLFTIFSKGGIVLWYFHGTTQLLTNSVNELIKHVILQERGLTSAWNHNTISLQYKLDNEFDLVFVVAYQNILKLSYVDKLLSDIQLKFRDAYKNDLEKFNYSRNYQDFKVTFDSVLRECESNARLEAVQKKAPRAYHETEKANMKVSSMVEKKTNQLPLGFLHTNTTGHTTDGKTLKSSENTIGSPSAKKELLKVQQDGDEENRQLDIQANLEKLKMRKFDKGAKDGKKAPAKKEDANQKKGKKPTNWDGGIEYKEKDLDYSGAVNSDGDDTKVIAADLEKYADRHNVGGMKGELRGLEIAESNGTDDEGIEDEEEAIVKKSPTSKAPIKKPTSGFFTSLKSLVGAKLLTQDTIQPIMEKMQEHLIAKNVASEIAKKLCDNVAFNLEGKQAGSFQSVTNIVKQALNESLVQILTPKKRVDILRDVIDAKKQQRPFVIVFCGVNGVGKSTNLAKVTYWLIENSFNVLIAACDTFRAGAVEQLRTHTKHLNSLHPADMHNNRQMVQLYEKGYGKDAAGIAMEAINYARDSRIDVVLVDTAGRMQDNEPLMKALAKLININQPDLVLFVGEALVGNEAVDQVRKFNQALIDNSTITNTNEQARLIDGIVLTKFDTIDDKVGAAISMTYTTGQPIVFVGTGQKYADLKTLNAKSVVQSLLK